MVSESPVSYVQCPSCLRRNHSEMQFCIYCGAGVTTEAEKKRTANPLTWRTCIRCGQTDELNQNFCIFCSGKIVVPGGDQPDSSAAFKRFSWELEQIDAHKVMDRADEEPVQQPVKVKIKRSRKGGKGIGLTILMSILGILTGSGLSFMIGFIGPERLVKIPKAQQKAKLSDAEALCKAIRQVVLQSTSWRNNDLVVYTEVPNATVSIEGAKGRVYFLTEIGPEGSLGLSELPAGDYVLNISATGHKKVRQPFPLVEKKTTVLGYPDRLVPPKLTD